MKSFNIHMNVSFVSLIHRLRWKYRKNNDIKNDEHLTRLLWYSFPIVYIRNEFKIASHDYDLLVAKRKRYKRYVREMIYNFCNVYLLTLTFSDEYYLKNSTQTRKKYATRFLNDVCDDYFACLDIGSENHREHFHCIVSFKPEIQLYYNEHKKLKILKDSWEYGYYDIKKIGNDSKSFHSTLNYAFKSACYSIKNSNGKSIKPFHKRGVLHYKELENDYQLF